NIILFRKDEEVIILDYKNLKLIEHYTGSITDPVKCQNGLIAYFTPYSFNIFDIKTKLHLNFPVKNYRGLIVYVDKHKVVYYNANEKKLNVIGYKMSDQNLDPKYSLSFPLLGDCRLLGNQFCTVNG